MAGFLTTISDIQLVEEYGWWIIERNESTGMKIFMPNDAKRAALFDSEQNLLLFKTKTSREGHLAYLEYLVLQRKSEVPEHHTSLCLLYTDKLSQLLGDATLSAKHEELVHSFKDQRREDLYDLSSQEVDLKKGTLDLQGRTFVGFLRQNSSADPISFSREKLLSLLQYSSYYDVEEVLIKVKALPSLQSERAVLSAKMSKHKDSIRLIVREVMDYYGAEIFCLNAGEYHPPKKSTRKQQTTEPCRTKGDTKQADEKRRKLFMYLLGEYLEIPFHEGGTALSLHLLNTQSYFLELSEVIHLLPPSWSVELLHQYLSRSLRRSQHEFKEIQVIKGLSLGENLRISEELHQLYQAQGPVVLTADDVCHVCGMAVADSVFMRTVDMQTIHLHCGSEPSKIS
ncbi:transforming growth factor, beta receptor associated protein 1 [Lunasporangiospora selenospora]|uniref:Transforming growth factor, beta receptor associated protein 1 n=1 Tax=Lunasporangiospora selenospora TaxID=979761 RepID=A0A9P6FMX0_9FUNG|nr:transforming growth factor, beta receptor associated protein 1 [Lunasporangiospora selenospora]